MKKLYEIARQKRNRQAAEIQGIATSRSSASNSQPAATSLRQASSANTLQLLLERSNISDISSIKSLKPQQKTHNHIINEPLVPQPPVISEPPIIQRKDYKQRSRDQIAKLKEKRLELEKTMTTEVSVVAIREAERVWDEVEQENQRLKDGAVRMIKHMAAGTIQKLIKRYCFITGWKQIDSYARVRKFISQKEEKIKRRFFDLWAWQIDQLKQEARRLAIMKQRLREADILKKQINGLMDG